MRGVESLMDAVSDEPQVAFERSISVIGEEDSGETTDRAESHLLLTFTPRLRQHFAHLLHRHHRSADFRFERCNHRVLHRAADGIIPTVFGLFPFHEKVLHRADEFGFADVQAHDSDSLS